MLTKVYKFLRYNRYKKMVLVSVVLSAYYRSIILLLPKTVLHKQMGNRGEESSLELPIEYYRLVARVSRVVNRICDQTPWESKCLVRAMTAQRILSWKKISSTLYLGVGKEEEKMIAHAWLRCGEYFVTGGNGSQYGMVAKFRKG
ncbi:MAG: lasso peptide biosynthesis B2 protein [Anaerocolumna sp.]